MYIKILRRHVKIKRRYLDLKTRFDLEQHFERIFDLTLSYIHLKKEYKLMKANCVQNSLKLGLFVCELLLEVSMSITL